MVLKYEHPVPLENVAPTPIWVTPKSFKSALLNVLLKYRVDRCL